MYSAKAGRFCVSFEGRLLGEAPVRYVLPPQSLPFGNSTSARLCCLIVVSGGKAALMLFAPRLRDKFPFYYGWVVVAASGTVVFARQAPAITTLTVLIFPMSQQLGWSRTLIAGAVSAGALAALVLSPVVGWAIDRFGARPVLVISVVVLGVAMTSLGKIRGRGEIGVLFGQATGPIIAGMLFDLQGGYTAIFTVFVFLALSCSLLVLKTKAPDEKRAALVA